MKTCNVYENDNLKSLLGQTLRPGGFALTEKAVGLCKFTKGDILLDLGCGCGATIEYLNREYGIRVVGIDPSEKLLNIAKTNYPSGDFILAKGEDLPFQTEKFDGVLSECTLSLMEDLSGVLGQVYRVLKNDGYFVITDVYAKEPVFLDQVNKKPANTCMRGLHDLQSLKECLRDEGFEIILLEDHSFFLKELMVKIIFSYGSMGIFWNKTSEACLDGEEFQDLLKKCKPGYFLMVAKKRG